MVFHRGVAIFFITKGGATRSSGQFEASIRNDVRREKWKKHMVPVITTGCLKLDWVSNSSPHLGLHLQSVLLLSVAKLQHRLEQISLCVLSGESIAWGIVE